MCRIPKGKTLSYKEVAERSGYPRAYRAVGNVLRGNYDRNIPCHRVIRSDGTPGAYNRGGSKKKQEILDEEYSESFTCLSSSNNFSSIKNFVSCLKKGGVGVMETDTVYGIVGQALRESTVRRVSALKNRSPQKSYIILISSVADLRSFSLDLSRKKLQILRALWPGPISIILPCKKPSLTYLHKGRNSLAFRMPRARWLREILRETGPLIASTANPEGCSPPKSLIEARAYFGDKVDFYCGPNVESIFSRASTLIELFGNDIVIKRKGTMTQANIRQLLTSKKHLYET